MLDAKLHKQTLTGKTSPSSGTSTPDPLPSGPDLFLNRLCQVIDLSLLSHPLFTVLAAILPIQLDLQLQIPILHQLTRRRDPLHVTSRLRFWQNLKLRNNAQKARVCRIHRAMKISRGQRCLGLALFERFRVGGSGDGDGSVFFLQGVRSLIKLVLVKTGQSGIDIQQHCLGGMPMHPTAISSPISLPAPHPIAVRFPPTRHPRC